MHFRIEVWDGFYLDDAGHERACFVYRLGPDEERVIDAETRVVLDPPPQYYKLQDEPE